MTDQLARAGTSVGANIHEAQYAQSKKDFVAKLGIALKESNETSYWLKLMYETKRIDTATYQYAEKLCGKETVISKLSFLRLTIKTSLVSGAVVSGEFAPPVQEVQSTTKMNAASKERYFFINTPASAFLIISKIITSGLILI